MSDPDHFLSRWSRRKLAPEQDDAPSEPGESKPPIADEMEQAPASPQPIDDTAKEDAFDPASLPSLDSITAGTDIRDFLKPGVPASLSRAALRRAWSSDPAIRDFIGMAENQWDFTDPNAMAGFGALDPMEVPRLLSGLFGCAESNTEELAALRKDNSGSSQSSAPAIDAKASKTDVADNTQSARQDPPAESSDDPAQSHDLDRGISHRNKENDAAQNTAYAEVRHGHGSAMPR